MTKPEFLTMFTKFVNKNVKVDIDKKYYPMSWNYIINPVTCAKKLLPEKETFL